LSNNLFVCEKCGGVTPDTCLKCPDRGHGNGVTVQTIKDHINAGQNHAEVQQARKHYARHIATLERKGGDARTMAIQIRNLVAYRCEGFRT